MGYIASSDLEGFSLAKDLPFDREVLLFAFQLSDVLAKFCAVLALFVVERHLMDICFCAFANS